MSRRHKEPDNKEHYEPEQMESHDDGHLGEKSGKKSNEYSLFGGMNSLFSVTASKFFSQRIVDKLVEKICTKVLDAFVSRSVEVDDLWVKIPRSAFDELGDGWLDSFRKQANPQTEEPPKESKRGAPRIKRLFNKIADSKVMKLFHKTWNEVQKKRAELERILLRLLSSWQSQGFCSRR